MHQGSAGWGSNSGIVSLERDHSPTMDEQQALNFNFKKEGGRIWLYSALKIFTVVYVMLQLAVFFLGFSDLPHEIANFWMWGLGGYVVLKEACRWRGVKLSERQGELLAFLVIGAFLLMAAINLVRGWLYGLSYLELPAGYFESAVEALALLIASTISSVLHESWQGE